MLCYYIIELYKFEEKQNMNNTTKDNLIKYMDQFATIFSKVDTITFLKKLANDENYWSMISNDEKAEIEKIINEMVQTARIEETRKEQQKFFYPVLEAINKPDIKEKFNSDEQFRSAFIALSLIFLAGFHAMNHKDEAHHTFIFNNLKEAISKIIK